VAETSTLQYVGNHCQIKISIRAAVSVALSPAASCDTVGLMNPKRLQHDVALCIKTATWVSSLIYRLVT